MENTYTSLLISRCLYIAAILLAFDAGICKSSDDGLVAMDQIERVNRNSDSSAEDVAIFENDIRLPPLESDAASGEFSNALRMTTRLWPGGVVPYVLHASIINRSGHMEALRKAMEIWENNTCVKFVKRTTESRYAYIYYGSSGCNSNIGALRSRPSALSLGYNCGLVSIAAHELAHLLGFAHEQNRPDRDQYVDIQWQNIAPANHKIFGKKSPWAFHSFGTQYDYKSLMHYGRYHFSKNGKPTIVSRDPKVKWFGNLSPSELDIKEMNLLYSCPEIPVFPDHFSLRSETSTSLICVAIDQPRDTEWRVKYLCYKPALKKLTITWSPNGTIVGQHCINTRMPYERAAAVWENSFLCVPHDSLLKFSWSVSGQVPGKECLEVRRTTRNTRGYFLCGTSKFKKIDGGWSRWSSWRSCSEKCGGGFRMRTRSCDSPKPKYGGAQCRGNYYQTISCNTENCPEFPSWPHDFRFQFISFTPKRQKCIFIYERYQYSAWARARLCWPSNKRDVDIRWSDWGDISGMRCTRITQQSGRYQPNGWHDNYLCVPKDSPYVFTWSTNGRIKGLQCLQWQNDAFSRRKLWQNNYLCANEYPKPTVSPVTGCYPKWRSFFVNRVPHCYLVLPNKRLKWEEAEEFCNDEKSHLVSIKSKEEQNFIRSIIGSNAVWIGFQKKRDWQWTDGSSVEYLNWSSGEPNNGGEGRPEKCAMNSARSGQWNDFPCDTKFSFICKMRGGS